MDRLMGKTCGRVERYSEQRQANKTKNKIVIVNEHLLHTYYVSDTLQYFTFENDTCSRLNLYWINLG